MFTSSITSPKNLAHTAKKLLASTIMLSFLMTPGLALANTAHSDAIQIKGGISVGVSGEELIPSLSLRDAEIKDVLYSLAEQAGFNLIVDDTVSGTISLDLKNISINKVMEYMLTLADLTYYKDGDTFIVTSTEEANTKALNRLVLKSIPVKHSDATTLAFFLNSTVFGINRPGGNTNATAAADLRTNSILIMGNELDIDLANRALAELDFPLQRKTFFLKYAAPASVAQAITQILYSSSIIPLGGGGMMGGGMAGGGMMGGGMGGGMMGGGMGGGMMGGGGMAGGGAGGGMAGGAGGGDQGGGPTFLNITTFRGGPLTFVSNGTNNTLTLIGTAEQIEMAESLLYDLDIRPAQVAIELTILSLTQGKTKSFVAGLNRENVLGGGSSTFRGTNNYFGFNDGGETILGWDRRLGRPSTSFIDNARLHAVLQETKAKTLANPTLLTLSGQEASVDSTRDLVSGISQTVAPTTGLTTTTIQTTPVGINLSVTPTVFNDGTIGMEISPSISDERGSFTFAGVDGQETTISLTSNTNLSISQARVRDGETLILAGIIQDKSTSTGRKTPFLGDLPLVGSLFRGANSNINDRQEIVILVTPHIIKEEGVPYFRNDWRNQVSYNQLSGPGNLNYAASPPDKGVIPAANTLSPSSEALQTLEHRIEDAPKRMDRSSNIPFQTFSEVLK